MDDWMVEFTPVLASLIALADSDGRMTEAAAAIEVPQSSMSRRIRALEDTLGVALVIPDGRGLRLTARAVQLADQLRPLLRAADEVIGDLIGESDPNQGTLRFGFPLTLGSGTVPALLADFVRKYPRVRLNLRQAHGQALVDDLRRGILDLAITIPAPDDLPHTVLAEQQVLAVVSSRHPLAEKVSIDLGDLEGERFIANPGSYDLRQRTEEWCAAAGFVSISAIEVTEFDTVRDFVSRDLGVALRPRSSRRFRGVVEVPLAGDRFMRTAVLARTAQRLSPIAHRFNEFVVERGFALRGE